MRFISLPIFLLICSFVAFHDYAAAQSDDQIKSAAVTKLKSQDIKQKRMQLGKLAEGRSDAEVSRLYDKKVNDVIDDAMLIAKETQSKMKSAEANQSVKSVTGKNMQEIMNMSDKEKQALLAELEKKMAENPGIGQ